ncbi:MAG: hypothetical protein GX316_11205 [Firmicutes bacterium]|nr:hypothetical protein [Bacillota bacterium]
MVYGQARSGIYLEFRGEPGYDLVTKSLENYRPQTREKQIRLLNVRTEMASTEDAETTYATVFVPNSQKNRYFRYLERYMESINKEKPKHRELIESISEIKKALDIAPFWVDSPEHLPSTEPEWCEIWLNGHSDDIIQKFEKLCQDFSIPLRSGVTRFPERAVKVAYANKAQLDSLIQASDDIAEIRVAKTTAHFWTELAPFEQSQWIKSLLKQMTVTEETQVAVCILDTGVNYGHPLLDPILKEVDCQAVCTE